MTTIWYSVLENLEERLKKEHKYIVCRKMRKFNQAEFLMDVTNVPWGTIVRSFETVEDTVHLFTETLNLIIEKHAPLL